MAKLTSRDYDKYPPWTVDDARVALSYFTSAGNEQWYKIGMMLRSELGDAGFEVFHEWSKSIDGYKGERDCLMRWRSFNGAGLTVSTMVEWAGDGLKQYFTNKASHDAKASADDIKARADEIEKRRKQLDDEHRQKAKAAAEQAANQWNHGAMYSAPSTHPYLIKKRVKAYGIKAGTMVWNDKEGKVKEVRDALIIPLRNMNGQITTLQSITGDGVKILMAGGQKAGSFHKIDGDDSAIIFSEGYSTSATVFEATGYTTVACIDSGNIIRVIEKWREAMPMKRFIIAGDNDQWGGRNTGLEASRDAAAKFQCEYCVPKFNDSSLDSRPTDFNDLMLLEGIDAVRAQLLPVINPREGIIPIDQQLPKKWWHERAKSDKTPLDVKENLEDMIKRYGITIRQNAITKSVDIDIPGIRIGNPDNQADQSFLKLVNIAVSNDLARGTIGDHASLIAMENSYNPVELFIKSRPWDGVSRFAELFETITFEEGSNLEFYAMLLRRWLISAVAAAVKPYGFFSKGVLVMQGPQSAGKTQWIKSLLPPHMSNLLNTGAMLDPTQKDSITGAIRHWIVELGELDATVRLADMARLKAFVTNQVDTLRLPYAKTESRFQRRTVFFASVNPRDFQKDITGSTRWWSMAVTRLNYEHDIDLQQLWAEVYEWYMSGERWWLNHEDEMLLEAENDKFKSMSLVEMSIREGFKWELHDTSSRTKMSIKQILNEIGFEKPSDKDISTAREIVKRLTGEEGSKSHGVMKFSMPPVADTIDKNINNTRQRASYAERDLL